jgi:hypothetical protein
MIDAPAQNIITQVHDYLPKDGKGLAGLVSALFGGK